MRWTPAAFEARYRRYLARRDAFSLARFLTERLTSAAMISYVLSERPRYQEAPPGPLLQRRYDFSLWDVDARRYPWVTRAFEQHLDNIRALRRMADEHGAELVLITAGIPDAGLHARLRAFLAREIPNHLDLAAPMAQAVGGRRTHYHHDPHWNALGNRLAAQIMHRYLRARGL